MPNKPEKQLAPGTRDTLHDIANDPDIKSVGYLWGIDWAVIKVLCEIQARRLVATPIPTRPIRVYDINVLNDSNPFPALDWGASPILPQKVEHSWIEHRIRFWGEGCGGDDLMIFGQYSDRCNNVMDAYGVPHVLFLDQSELEIGQLSDCYEWQREGDCIIGIDHKQVARRKQEKESECG